VRAVLVGVAFAAVGLELVLQIVAFVLWSRRDAEPVPVGDVVVCLGDSLTFGLGMPRQDAYPAQLEAKLRAVRPDWNVVNAGIPGQNSADVLGRLPDLLAKYEPEVVCVLIGWNDGWSRPRALAPEEVGPARFPWRWRTGRLLALASAQVFGETPSERPPAFLGSWRLRGQGFHFAADGTVRLGDGSGRWENDGSTLRITPAGGAPFEVRWRECEGGIEFALPGWDRFQRLWRGWPDERLGSAEFDEALELGELDRARAIVLASTDPAAVLVMQGRLGLALLAAGRRDDSLALLRELEGAWNARRDAVAGAAVAQWRAANGEIASAVTVADAVVAIAPDQVAGWRVLVDHCAAADRAALAVRLEAAIETQSSAWRRAELRLELAVLTAPTDPAAAIGHLLTARRDGIGSDETIAAMRRAVAVGGDAAPLLAAAAAAPLPPNEREALERDVRRAVVGVDEVHAVLEHHVRLAAGACRAAGARLVLLGYPFPHPRHEEAMQRIAAAEQATFVSTVAAFQARLAESPRGDWFVDEIHCSARGYELLASLVAEALAASRR